MIKLTENFVVNFLFEEMKNVGRKEKQNRLFLKIVFYSTHATECYHFK